MMTLISAAGAMSRREAITSPRDLPPSTATTENLPATTAPREPRPREYELTRSGGPNTPPIGQVPDPGSLLVLVDHDRYLPPDWVPPDLIETQVPFVFDGPSPKRLLRAEAAAALARLVAAAHRDGVEIVGISGFRSEQAQRTLFDGYVAERGRVAASVISARPGHSEHQTGLAIDVTGEDHSCQASDCFADTTEALWLAEHAFTFGWLVRYPPGAEQVTGYQAEPWHLRYVGPTVGAELQRRGLTFDQYLGAA